VNQLATSYYIAFPQEEESQGEQKTCHGKVFPYLCNWGSKHLTNGTAVRTHSSRALSDIQVKAQPETSDCYREIVKSLAERRTEFHTYKLHEERGYRGVLKICTTPSTLTISISKVENLGHTRQTYTLLNNIELSYSCKI
jgi:hypothetical protein